MDHAKVKAVQEWNTTRKVQDLQGFQVFANFYQPFILSLSKIAKPLTQLTRKGLIFEWNSEVEAGFSTLKTAFTRAPIHAHFVPDKEILVETDASDFVSAGILSQYNVNHSLHQVEYLSINHYPHNATTKYTTKNC